MRIQTMGVVLVGILLAVLLIQNTGGDHLNFLWMTIHLSKLIMLFVVAGIGFLFGYLAGRPKNVKRLGGDFVDPDLGRASDTLSDEDRDYIN